MILPGWWTIMSRTCQSPSCDRYSNTPLSSGPGDPRAIGTYGVLVGMFLAVVTWPTLITRNTRLQSLGRGRICPSGPPRRGFCGDFRNGVPDGVQKGMGENALPAERGVFGWGGSSPSRSCQLAGWGGQNDKLGEQIGRRLPSSNCQHSFGVGGVWVAVADRDVAVAAPGAS